MIYTEENILGVEFNIHDLKHIILEHPSKSDEVQIAISGNINGSRGDWKKSTVKTYLNEGGSWKPVISSQPYEIY